MARGLALAVLALLVVAAPAAAVDKPATCANLQTVLNGAADDDVITLNSSAGPGGLCSAQYTLKSFPSPTVFPNNYTQWTLKGRDGMNDGFDGSGLAGRVLTGVDVHRLELQNLTFRDSTVTGNGGAIDITGESSLGLRSSKFLNNHATGRGGAIHLAQADQTVGGTLGGVGFSDDIFGSQTTPSEGNSATTGGAVSIESPGTGNNNSGINGSTFANNVATANGGGFDYALPAGSAENFSLGGNTVVKNRAGGNGGGGHAAISNTIMYVDNELYRDNSLTQMQGGPDDVPHIGGGLYIESPDGAPIQPRHSVFRGNTVGPFDSGDSVGGGLAIRGDGTRVSSEFSRIEGNTVGGDGSFESEGGGLYIEGDGASYYGFLDAIAGNHVGVDGRGGGVYTGAATGTALEFGEATVAGNTVGSGGEFAGIAGNGSDTLTMRNSIVYNGGPGDVGGFTSSDVQYSDACDDGPDPFAGPGNICADPKLAGGADVHQTKQSPTIDRGSDDLFQQEGGERPNTDYEDDPRPTDGDGDGHTVDMGADETPAGFIAQDQQPIIPPPPPQCSDGSDNDGDGAIDGADPGCLPGPTDDNEGDETPGDLVLCGSRDISLVRADVKGSKVSLSGFVATRFAGQKVAVSVRYLGKRGKPKQVGSVTAGSDGSFRGRVAKPSRKLFTAARYRAQVGSAKSVELKLPQSLASSSLKRAGGMLELRGQVDRAVLGKRNQVVVKRILCGHYATVGQAKPDRKGRYVVRFPAPASGGSALYRAETKVLARPGSRRYVKQFARAIGITF
jgi:hypothetical protein